MNRPTFDYPFTELWDHLSAINIVSQYDHVTLANGQDMELPAERSFGDMALRVMDYMRQLYPSKEESFFKGSRLVMILNHAATEIQEFEDAKLAVIGSDESGSIIEERAWRALHHFYVEQPLDCGKKTTAEIIAYALTLPKD